MILLAIPDAVLPDTLARAIRRRGHLLAETDPDTADRLCAALPVSAILCLDDRGLRPRYPRRRILTLDDETTPADLTAMLATLREPRPTRRTSLYLPADRRESIVLVDHVDFTPAEYTLLRVLAEAYTPIPSRDLAPFLGRRCPGDDSASVKYHFSRIREKAEAASVPPLVSYIAPDGFSLAFPYCLRLDE